MTSLSPPPKPPTVTCPLILLAFLGFVAAVVSLVWGAL